MTVISQFYLRLPITFYKVAITYQLHRELTLYELVILHYSDAQIKAQTNAHETIKDLCDNLQLNYQLMLINLKEMFQHRLVHVQGHEPKLEHQLVSLTFNPEAIQANTDKYFNVSKPITTQVSVIYNPVLKQCVHRQEIEANLIQSTIFENISQVDYLGYQYYESREREELVSTIANMFKTQMQQLYGTNACNIIRVQANTQNQLEVIKNSLQPVYFAQIIMNDDFSLAFKAPNTKLAQWLSNINKDQLMIMFNAFVAEQQSKFKQIINPNIQQVQTLNPKYASIDLNLQINEHTRLVIINNNLNLSHIKVQEYLERLLTTYPKLHFLFLQPDYNNNFLTQFLNNPRCYATTQQLKLNNKFIQFDFIQLDNNQKTVVYQYQTYAPLFQNIGQIKINLLSGREDKFTGNVVIDLLLNTENTKLISLACASYPNLERETILSYLPNLSPLQAITWLDTVNRLPTYSEISFNHMVAEDMLLPMTSIDEVTEFFHQFHNYQQANIGPKITNIKFYLTAPVIQNQLIDQAFQTGKYFGFDIDQQLRSFVSHYHKLELLRKRVINFISQQYSNQAGTHYQTYESMQGEMKNLNDTIRAIHQLCATYPELANNHYLNELNTSLTDLLYQYQMQSV